MCLMLFAWDAHPDYRLVFAGNRDEAYARPSAPAAFWDDEPQLFGGRDLEKGGSWLGLTLSGRMAAVTNYRDGPPHRSAPRSRGELVANFLRMDAGARPYLEQIHAAGGQYGGFSLVVGDLARIFYCTNRGDGFEETPPGVHGLSNHLLDTPWPKVRMGRKRVAALLGHTQSNLVNGLFEFLADRTVAPDAELPDTGIGLQRERELSPCFIAGERYGTRASTVLLIGRDNEVLFLERTFGPGGAPLGAAEHRFSIEAPAPEQESATDSKP
ncbi:MAG: NRDE family protein [Betaproteobacteria bacterium]|nr:MAG: NRDE family protein [Betaproteobacteria bacterium]